MQGKTWLTSSDMNNASGLLLNKPSCLSCGFLLYLAKWIAAIIPVLPPEKVQSQLSDPVMSDMWYVNMTTMEIPQRTLFLNANYCVQVHNANVKEFGQFLDLFLIKLLSTH